MALVERLRARPWLAAAGAGAIVGVLIGLFLPIRAASPTRAQEADWKLPPPAAVKRFNDTDYQAVRSARFWGELQRPGAPGNQAVAWTLAGIVTKPLVRIAVTASGKPAVSWIRPGDTLPDGATFVAASRDTVWTEKDGCRRARKLYQKPSPETEACIGAAQPAPAAAPPATPPVRRSP